MLNSPSGPMFFVLPLQPNAASSGQQVAGARQPGFQNQAVADPFGGFNQNPMNPSSQMGEFNPGSLTMMMQQLFAMLQMLMQFFQQMMGGMFGNMGQQGQPQPGQQCGPASPGGSQSSPTGQAPANGNPYDMPSQAHRPGRPQGPGGPMPIDPSTGQPVGRPGRPGRPGAPSHATPGLPGVDQPYGPGQQPGVQRPGHVTQPFNGDVSQRRNNIMDWARGQLGNTDISRYNGHTGAWCADFVSTALNQNGGSPWGHKSAVRDIKQWGIDNGQFIPAGELHRVQPGDAVIIDQGYWTDNAGKSHKWSHTGLVEKIDPDGTVHTIDGNYAGKVSRVKYNIHDGNISGFVKSSPEEPGQAQGNRPEREKPEKPEPATAG